MKAMKCLYVRFIISHELSHDGKKMMDKTAQIVVSSTKSVEDHVLEIITMMNQGTSEVEIKGFGREINKVVDIYNQLKDKLGEGIKLSETSIGSEVKDKKRISYLLLRITKAY